MVVDMQGHDDEEAVSQAPLAGSAGPSHLLDPVANDTSISDGNLNQQQNRQQKLEVQHNDHGISLNVP